MAYRLEMGSKSEKGRRSNNQDAVAVDPGGGFAVVADGMGGAAGGAEASRLAVEASCTLLRARLPGTQALTNLLEEVVAEANREVHQAAEATPALEGMGTTLVVLAVKDGRYAVANVGDSRAYRLRAGALDQLSRDHSLVQARVEAGIITEEQASRQTDRNVITRAIGVGPQVQPDLAEGEVQGGDVFLLTSDGVHAFVPTEVILEAGSAAGSSAAAARLVDEALTRDSNDNATAAVVRVREDTQGETTAELEELLAKPLSARRGAGGGRALLPWLWLAAIAVAGVIGLAFLAPRVLSLLLGPP